MKDGTGRPPPARLVFLALVCLLFALTAWTARDFPPRARIFPQVVAVGGLLVGIVAAIRELQGRGRVRDERPGGFTGHFRKAIPYLCWLVLYYAAIYLVGLMLASGLFVVAFLVREARLKWYRAALGGVLVSVLLMGLASFVGLDWPTGLLTGW